MPDHNIRILTPDDFRTTRWSGGTTTELLIFPRDAVYADRDFLWRVSSAAVEDEVSLFTPLPDYERLIATLQGDIILRHNVGAPLKLHPLDVHAFDGGAVTESAGRCRDFNLMLRKGRAEGSLDALLLSGPGKDAAHRLLRFSGSPEEILIYCAEGSCLIREENAREYGLEQGFALYADCTQGLSPLTAISSSAVLMIAQMRRLSSATGSRF